MKILGSPLSLSVPLGLRNDGVGRVGRASRLFKSPRGESDLSKLGFLKPGLLKPEPPGPDRVAPDLGEPDFEKPESAAAGGELPGRLKLGLKFGLKPDFMPGFEKLERFEGRSPPLLGGGPVRRASLFVRGGFVRDGLVRDGFVRGGPVRVGPLPVELVRPEALRGGPLRAGPVRDAPVLGLLGLLKPGLLKPALLEPVTAGRPFGPRCGPLEGRFPGGLLSAILVICGLVLRMNFGFWRRSFLLWRVCF